MTIRDEFDAAMRHAVEVSCELGYTPTRFMQMIDERHPIDVAKYLVVSGDFQYGIKELAKMDRLDLSIESLMLDARFTELFTPQELSAAKWRLDNVPTDA